MHIPPQLKLPLPLRLLATFSAIGLLLAGCASMDVRQQNAKLPAQGTAPVVTAAAAAPAVAPLSAAASAPRAAASAPAGAASAAKAPVPAVDPAAPKPIADVIKDAKEQAGLFPIWRKDEKVWMEIPKSGLNKPFLFTVNVANSVGERGLYASQMSYEALVEWRRIGNQMQLIAINTKYRGDGAGGGSKLAVSQAFSPSLVAGMVVASAEHPERKSVLVDAAFMLSDIAGYSTRIESAFRLPFGLDRSNSFFEATRSDASISTLNARVHFSTPRIPAPPLTPSPVPLPKPPQATPDPRSFFVTFVYNFSALPDKPMAARLSDPRLGHFTETFNDLSGDQTPCSTQRCLQ